MAKELVYRVRIDYDSSEAAKGAQTIDRTQEQAEEATQKTTAAIRRQQDAQEQMTKSSRGYDRVQSNANQTLFSFGDLLNDSQQFQYGFAQGTRAIGNNIGFAAEQFSQISQRTGGFMASVRALGSSLLGPGGLILAINAVVTAITVWGDSLFGSSDSVAEKSKKAREEIADLRREINRFETQFQQLSQIQEEAFPDLSQEDELRQQIQFATQLESNLQNRLTQQNEEVQLLERQVNLFEGLSDRSITYNEALQEGLISQRTAEAIAQGRVDVEGTLIRFQNQLNEAKIQQESLEVSVQSAQERQIKTQAELNELIEAQNTPLFEALQTRRRMQELEEARQIEPVEDEVIEPDIEIPEVQLDLGFPVGSIAQAKKRLNDLQEEFTLATSSEERKRIKIQANALRERLNQYESFEEQKTQIQRIAESQRQQLLVQGVAAAGQIVGQAFGQSKELAAAQTIISTYAAAQKAYESQLAIPTPDAPARAAAAASIAIAQGLARLAQITQTSLGGSGSISDTGGDGAVSVQQGIQTSTIDRSTQTEGVTSQNNNGGDVVVNLSGDIADESISIRAERGRKKRTSNVRTVRAESVT